MTDLAKIAPQFVEMAHRIVWASAATVDAKKRPRTRVLHPLWIWDGKQAYRQDASRRFLEPSVASK